MEYVISDLRSVTKREILRELSEVFQTHHPELEPGVIQNVLMAREQLGSTGIGEGIAVPHGKIAGIKEVLLSFGRSREGIPFESLDGKPAHLFFTIVAPENSNGIHLKLLANISRLLREGAVRDRLMQARTPEEVLTIISETDGDQESGI